MEDRYFETERQNIKLIREYENAAILDIGGGGEGFIGNLYGKNVIALDQRQDELDETNNDAIKLVMDAKELAFTDQNFDVVTLFYSLMYMNKETKQAVLSEAVRVLKPGGYLDIWDIKVPVYEVKGKDVFIAQLRVVYDEEVVNTGYGVTFENKDHSKESIQACLEDLGLQLTKEEVVQSSFRLQFQK